jgi:hypothetical protein
MSVGRHAEKWRLSPREFIISRSIDAISPRLASPRLLEFRPQIINWCLIPVRLATLCALVPVQSMYPVLGWTSI